METRIATASLLQGTSRANFWIT